MDQPPTPPRPINAASRHLGVLCLWMAVLAAGCMEERVVSSSWDNLEAMADPKASDDDRKNPNRPVRGQGSFAIKLADFQGSDRLKLAFDFSQKLRQEGGIADVWFLDQGASAGVYTGRFPRIDHPEAENRLKAIQALRFDGGRPFRSAQIVAVSQVRSASDPNDLSQYSGYRTLLLAVYDSKYPGAYRQAAERYADELRGKHDFEFYYYHGVNQSMVTTGLYTLKDFVSVNGIDQYGPAIRERQEQFPYALRNGQSITNPEIVGEDKREPTVIVNVP